MLWAAIRATQDRWPEATCVVYTGDHDAEKDAIIKRVQVRRSLAARTRLTVSGSLQHNAQPSIPTIRIPYHPALRSELTWPRFTLLGQSLGSLIVAMDAFQLLVPDIYIDTMGYAFTLGLCKWLFPTVPTAAYVHYPTISTDMLSSLDASASSNQGLHAGAGGGPSRFSETRVLASLCEGVRILGKFVDVVITNSSWTKSHIQELWGPTRAKAHGKEAEDISVMFPPVAVSDLEKKIDVSAASESSRQPHLLYIAQFRPDTDRSSTAFSELLASRNDWTAATRPRLVFVGSVRDRDDATRVYKLRLQAHELQIKDDVEFVCDASWPQVLDHLRRSSVGVNGMWNEHFGIGVVEYQASGLISVVNDSGGPKMDIVVDVDGKPTGMF